ncbi:BQ2448_6245 [Microbotryum intermedium]|uniref:BQ2448_6245 protein n=1 Tax=Microbotryum intermedium TaxID=269621 RepID=A0A238FKX9_9BASI|nr:BQ2448_6245 [Microbotryum intermedium]
MAETFPFKAVALSKYKSAPGTAKLAFVPGDELTVLNRDDDWYEGSTIQGQTGYFPVEAVRRLNDHTPSCPSETSSSATLTRVESVASPSPSSSNPSAPTVEADESAPLALSPMAPTIRSSAQRPEPGIAVAIVMDTSSFEQPRPTSLKDRIAALNAAAAEGPPPIRPKPREFKRFTMPVPAVDDNPPTMLSPILTSPVAPATESSSNASVGLSAEDAAESIGKGGGSLKDRIKALQGMQMMTPAAPGCASKPWKKNSTDTATGSEPERTADSAALAPRRSVTDDEQSDTAIESMSVESSTINQVPDDVEASGPATSVADSTNLDEDGVGAPKVSSDVISNVNEQRKHPVATEPTTEDSSSDGDAAQKATMAERAASIDGQRLAMAMPALPKRAAPPRRKPPAATNMPALDAGVVGETSSIELVAFSPKREMSDIPILSPPRDGQPVSQGDGYTGPYMPETMPSSVASRHDLLSGSTLEEPSDGNDMDTPAIPLTTVRVASGSCGDLAVAELDDQQDAAVSSKNRENPTRLQESALAHLERPSETNAPASRPDRQDEPFTRALSSPHSIAAPLAPSTGDGENLTSAQRPAIPQSFVVDSVAHQEENTAEPENSSLYRISDLIATIEPSPSSTPQLASDEGGVEDEAEAAKTEEQGRKPQETSDLTVLQECQDSLSVQEGLGVHDEEDGDKEEEEEDPELARRAALAARMARLGSISMRMAGGVMMPPIGGVQSIRKAVKTKADNSLNAGPEREILPDSADVSTAQAVAKQSSVPSPFLGIPRGGVALLGLGAPPAQSPNNSEGTSAAPLTQEQGGLHVLEEPQAPEALPIGQNLEQLEEELRGDQIVSDVGVVSVREEEDAVPEPPVHAVPAPPPRPRGGLPPAPAQPALSLEDDSEPAVPSSPQIGEKASMPNHQSSVASLNRIATRSSVGSRPTATSDALRRGSIELSRDIRSPSSTQHSWPAVPHSNLEEFSITLGAQVFAAAHLKLSEKGAKFSNDEELIRFCIHRVKDVQWPADGSYGVTVWGVAVSGKGPHDPRTPDLDEPRAGDIVIMTDCKFKATLSSTRVGADGQPKQSVCQAWDPKKRKLRTIEVGKNGIVEENSYKFDDLREGRVEIQRIVGSARED